MAGLIPQSFIQDLLARTDIVQVIGERLQLKKAGKEYVALSPFTTEKTPSFTVSPTKQFYHCFSSGKHGTAITFLMEYDRLSFPEAVEELAKRVGLTVPREGGAAPRALVLDGPLDALVCGGDRPAVEAVLSDPRLRGLAMLRVEPWLAVPDPRRAVLDQAVADGGSVTVTVTDPR